MMASIYSALREMNERIASIRAEAVDHAGYVAERRLLPLRSMSASARRCIISDARSAMLDATEEALAPIPLEPSPPMPTKLDVLWPLAWAAAVLIVLITAPILYAFGAFGAVL